MVQMSGSSQDRPMRRVILAGAIAVLLAASAAVAAPRAPKEALSAEDERAVGEGLLADAGQGKTVVISGGGWGHGIGMSQYGAYGRALNGIHPRALLLSLAR
jgi:SpoIID/LytB domain protein